MASPVESLRQALWTCMGRMYVPDVTLTVPGEEGAIVFRHEIAAECGSRTPRGDLLQVVTDSSASSIPVRRMVNRNERDVRRR